MAFKMSLSWILVFIIGSLVVNQAKSKLLIEQMTEANTAMDMCILNSESPALVRAEPLKLAPNGLNYYWTLKNLTKKPLRCVIRVGGSQFTDRIIKPGPDPTFFEILQNVQIFVDVHSVDE
ncbi:hypothetical protein PtA15_10A184 [Puccinia triticina]|uniref:Uncharacterized protein n=1 Tax=Puccinia triticina TaxID=208348 RepID=A0ABY7CUV5_9BASI|nr:uncharacterized protein PtA15_10A184 [Puccinia triticina]WAQ88765.1 hypothetical protein PtA15_10A184 [Puccinia triticina]